MQTDSELIDFLSKPENYLEKPVSITRHETHISSVFVGDTTVYKVKKPVNFGFLDFSSIEKRHFFCKEEVRLNRRLAPKVYLRVAPIYKLAGGYSFRKREGASVAEYAVKMRRIPEERLLSHLVRRGRLLPVALTEVGKAIARFHTKARAHKSDPFGGIDVVRTNTEENFEQIAPCLGITLDQPTYSRLVSYTRDFIENHEPLFGDRKQKGLVREGHGDLHSQHVCLIDPIVIVDCIEFNKRFRIGDVLEDIGFLLMDLEYRGRFDLSAAVSQGYFSLFPEAAHPGLLRFYKIYRAVVRGKIEGFTADVLKDEPGRQEAERTARDYYLLARHYADDGDRPFNPIVFMGVSGSGKSAIAQGLFDDALLLRSDRIRKELAGIAPERHVYIDYGAGMYGRETTAEVYRTMARRATEASLRGQRVVVDATFLDPSARLSFYEKCLREGLNPFFVFCFADEKTLRQRVARRMAEGRDLSDGHMAILERRLRAVKEPEELPSFRIMRLDTTEDSPVAIQDELRRFL